MKKWAGVLFVLLAWPLAGQRDFLRTDEIDQLRDMQEPNERLALYVKFARERIGLLEQYTSKEKTGRSVLIREALDEYTKIIEAIDTVADDALRRRRPLDKGVVAVASGEKEMLAALRKVQDSDPPDVAVYRFLLEQAIAATEDSLDLALQDLGGRAAEVLAKEEKERKAREAAMRPEEVQARREEEKKEAEQKKKVPTLRRPGEAPPAPRQ
jgi:hypothetical protein